jgi:hypothetical protein
MALFGRKMKIESIIEALRKRESGLASKQAAAKVKLDAAVVARQAALTGDDEVDDAQLEKLQRAVSDAASLLEGIGDALAAITAERQDAERQLAEQKLAAERKVASEALARKIADLEGRLPEFISAARVLIDAVAAVGNTSFEASQVATFLRGVTGETEIGVAFAISDLRHQVNAIASGDAPLWREPAEEVVALPAPVDPLKLEPTVEVFAVKSFRYRDVNGQRVVVGGWEDHLLPLRLQARASQRGVITSIDDPRRKTHRGILSGELVRSPIDLDSELLSPDPEQLPPGFVRLPGKPDRTILVPGPNA